MSLSVYQRAVPRLFMTSPMPCSASGSSKSKKPRSAAHTAASSTPTTRAAPARVTPNSATVPHGVAPPCSLPSRSLARSAHLVVASGRGRAGARTSAPLRHSPALGVGGGLQAGAGAGAPLRCFPTRGVVRMEGDDGGGNRSHVVGSSTEPELLRLLMTRIPQQRPLVQGCRGVQRGARVQRVAERCKGAEGADGCRRCGGVQRGAERCGELRRGAEVRTAVHLPRAERDSPLDGRAVGSGLVEHGCVGVPGVEARV